MLSNTACSLSPRLRHTLARLSVESRQYRDSSVKKTGLQSPRVQRTWSMAHSYHTLWWFRVNGMRMHGLLERRLPSSNLDRMVWVEILTPEAFWRSVRSWDAWITKNLSCAADVAFSLTPPWRLTGVPYRWTRLCLSQSGAHQRRPLPDGGLPLAPPFPQLATFLLQTDVVLHLH